MSKTFHAEITLPSEPMTVEGEEMVNILGSTVRCRKDGCINYWLVSINQLADALNTSNTKMDATMICARCGTRTLFEYEGGAISRPSDAPDEQLSSAVPEKVRATYTEAVEGYYGRTFRSSASMARAAVEEALVLKGVTPKRKDGVTPMSRPRLDDYIEEAAAIGMLTDDHKTAAVGARLIGNAALHRMGSVSWSLCLNALATTAELLEHIAAWTPPASQSGTGSSAP